MPALAKSNVGSSWGTHGDDFQYVWPLRLKYSMKVDRTLFAGHSSSFLLSSPVDDMMEEEISIATTIVEGSSKVSVYTTTNYLWCSTNKDDRKNNMRGEQFQRGILMGNAYKWISTRSDSMYRTG